MHRHCRRAYHPSVLPSLISTGSPEFVDKARSMDTLIADIDAKMATARLGGGERARDRMKKAGKKLPRERSVPLDP